MSITPTKAGHQKVEQTLRKQIRRAITKTRRGQTLTASAVRKAENETLGLFQKYSHAPKGERDGIWAEGRKRIRQALRGR